MQHSIYFQLYDFAEIGREDKKYLRFVVFSTAIKTQDPISLEAFDHAMITQASFINRCYTVQLTFPQQAGKKMNADTFWKYSVRFTFFFHSFDVRP